VAPDGGKRSHLRFERAADVDEVVEDVALGVMPDHGGEHYRAHQIPITERANDRSLALLGSHEVHTFSRLERLPNHGSTGAIVVAETRLVR
jgi:hypothetical protein